MMLKEALAQASHTLACHDIEDSTLEAEVSLRHVLGIERERLYAELGQELPPSQLQNFWQLVERRIRHEPTAYLVQHREFFGLDFYVDHRVLIPRPETELLVEKALELARNRYSDRNPLLIADVGTGSGAIAIALAQHLPQAVVYATDSSVLALEVAAINCRRHQVSQRVHLIAADILTPLDKTVDIIVSNLPYVKDSDLGELSPEVRQFEPELALAGGKDGLDKLRQLLSQAEGRLAPDGALLLEIGLGQGAAASELARGYFPGAVVTLFADLAGIDRVLSIYIDSQLS